MAADVHRIECTVCGWIRSTPVVEDALAYADYRSSLGECEGHRMNIELDQRARPEAGAPLWPIEIAAAHVFVSGRLAGRLSARKTRGKGFVSTKGVPNTAIAKAFARVRRLGFAHGAREARK